MIKQFDKQFKYQLSVGLIVKNEEHVLRRCLDSLAPLKKELDIEIIITDTGSTDGTIEIAKEYADKFLEFEWCNDFAKARNTGVEAAEGRWFLQLDADEFFDENVVEIAQFIKSNQSKNHKACLFTIRNYESKSRTTYKNATVARLFNFMEGKQYFEYSIHETIPVDINIAKPMNCLLYHDGYISEVMESKRSRNVDLVEQELEENPYNIRLYTLLVDCYGSVEKKLEICRRGLALSKEERESVVHLPYLKSLCCLSLFRLKKYRETMEFADEYLEEEKVNITPSLDILYLASVASIAISEFEQAVFYLDKYRKVYKQLKKKPDMVYSFFGIYSYTEEANFVDVQLKLIESYTRIENKEKARELLRYFNDFDYQDVVGNLIAYKNYVDLAKRLEEYNLIAESYKSILDKLDQLGNAEEKDKKRRFLISVIDKLYNNAKDEEVQSDILRAFTGRKVYDGYTALNALRYYKYDLNQCEDNVMKKLQEEELLYTESMFSDVLYANLLNGDNPVAALAPYAHETLFSFVCDILKNHSDFKMVICKLLIDDTDLAKQLDEYTRATLAYAYLINSKTLAEPDESDIVISLFQCFVECTYENMKKYYVMDHIQHNLAMIPNREKFVVFLYEAYQNKGRQPAQYVKELRKGLKYCSQLGDSIGIIAKNIKEDVDKSVERKSEFDLLGQQVKMQIKMFIQANQLDAARSVLAQYEKINPSDSEIPSLHALLR